MRPCFTIIFCLVILQGYSQDSVAPAADKKYHRNIEKLARQKKVQAAFREIDRLEPKTRETLIALTEIPAPPFNEGKRAAEFQKMLQQRGADSVWIDAEGNVLALRKGGGEGKIVVLDAHLDTVFPEETDVTVKMVGDTLFAPGVGDDTRGLSMVLTILEAMNKASIETNSDVLFIGTVGEEGLGDLRGVKHFFKEWGDKIGAWIAIDGGSLETITNKALGSYRYRITFKGPGGHSWGAFGLGNPHHAAASAIQNFTVAAQSYVSEGPKTSYNVGRIGGGTSINAIPFESWMEIDMRSVSPERLKGIERILLEEVKNALDTYNSEIAEGPPLTVEIEKIGDRPSGETAAEEALVQHALAATEYFESTPVLRRSSTDSNIPIARGIPAITIGRGGQGDGAHSLDEWWMNDASGPVAIKRALLILLAEAGVN